MQCQTSPTSLQYPSQYRAISISSLSNLFSLNLRTPAPNSTSSIYLSPMSAYRRLLRLLSTKISRLQLRRSKIRNIWTWRNGIIQATHPTGFQNTMGYHSPVIWGMRSSWFHHTTISRNPRLGYWISRREQTGGSSVWANAFLILVYCILFYLQGSIAILRVIFENRVGQQIWQFFHMFG